MAGAKPIRFQYEPETMIRETEQMRAIEELAYRRILDLIILYRNRLIDDDAEMGRMTKTGEAWPQIKARLVNDHEAFYVLDGFIRNVRYDDVWKAVERTARQKSQAGKASAAKRAKKNAAPAQPPVPVDPAPVEASPQQPLTDPPDAPAMEPPPMVAVSTAMITEPAPAPMNGNGAGDESTEPERAGTTIPQDWKPNTEGIAFAAARGYTPQQTERLVRTFVARHDQRGDKSTDWDAGFKLWVLRDLASNPRPAVVDHPPTPAV